MVFIYNDTICQSQNIWMVTIYPPNVCWDKSTHSCSILDTEGMENTDWYTC